MKKNIRLLLIMFVVILTFALATLCFVACEDDPTDGDKYTLTLVAGDGGSLAQSQYELEQGVNLADFLKDIRPTANAGFTFVGWYDGSNPLSSGRTMPAANLTLTAKYNVNYTVKLYRQATDGSYPTNGEVSTGQALYGEAFTYSSDEDHFTIDETRSNYSSESLTKDAVFEIYLEREMLTVGYLSNLNNVDVKGDVEWQTVRYGATVTIANGADYLAPAYYRFAGWATYATGDVEYVAGATITVSRDVYLFAQWDRAYLDRFGGSDMIFFPRSDETVAILVRQGLGEKLGVRDGNTFYFEEANLSGIVSADGSYAYFKEEEHGTVYTNWNTYFERLEENVTLELDGYMSGTCSYVDEDGQEQSFDGKYRLSQSGLYYFEITTGQHRGAFFYFILSEMSQSGTPVFIAMGREALYGYVYYALMADLNGNYSISTSYTAVFDGFGYVSVSGYGTFYYRPGERENEFIAYIDEVDVMRMYVVDFGGGTYGWILYDDEIAGNYQADDGSTLTLDGYGFSSTYSANGNDVSSMWMVDGYSELQNAYLIVTEKNTFLINYNTRRFRKIDHRFYELYLLSADALNPVVSKDYRLVYFDNGDVELYYNGELAACGTSQYLGAGIYEYTQTELLIDGLGLPAKMSFKMMSYLDYYGTGDTYPVYIMAESTDSNGQVTKYYHSYFESNGNEIRAYDVGTADYILKSGTVYQTSGYYEDRYMDPFYYDYLMFSYRDNAGRSNKLCFRIEEDKSLTQLTRLAWSVPQGLLTHKQNGMVILKLDGKDRAFFYPPSSDNRPAMYGKYTVKQTGNVFSSNVVIYTFTAENDPTYTFDFILTEIDGYEVFIRYDANYAGEFTSTSSGRYQLDGYAQNAFYYDNRNVLHSGSYYVLGNNAVRFVDSKTGETRDFEFDPVSRTFIDLDGYYGEYRCYDYFEFAPERVVLHFDGKGGVELGHLDYNDKYVKDAEGTYTIYNDDTGVLLVKINDYDGYDPVRVLLLLVDVGYDEYYAYVRSFADEQTYVSDKWEVLTLDGFGYATYVNEMGVVYRDVLYVELEVEEGMPQQVVFVVGSDAYTATLNGNSFEITDKRFNPILLAEYGDIYWLYYGEGEPYLSVYQIDAEGTIVVYSSGKISRYGYMTDAEGKAFEVPPITDYSVVYYGNGGGLITIDFQYGGYYCHVEYTISEFLGTLYYVTSASYYWTETADWTKDNYTVRVYRQVRGSDSTVAKGSVRKFELAIDGNFLPVYDYAKTANGTDYAKVLDGDYKGYYFVTFNKNASGVPTGVNLITKWDVHTVTSTDYASDGTAIIATAYYVMNAGELYDINIRYTQSDFRGQVYDLTTQSVRQIKTVANSWYVYCTFNYGGSYYVSDFHYVFNYNGGQATLAECLYGNVYTVDGNYMLTMLIGYNDLAVYDFEAFYINGSAVTIKNWTKESNGSYRITTETAVYRVTVSESSGAVVAEVEVVTGEVLKTRQAEFGGVTYTITYSVKLNSQDELSDLISIAVGNNVIVYFTYEKVSNGVFNYVVLDSDYQGYYVITFALSDSGEVQGVSIEKREISTVNYSYEYAGGETTFIAYYLMENGELSDVLAMAYKLSSGGSTYFFDPYLKLNNMGNGKWWVYYQIDTTYYHFVITLGEEPDLMLCYYAPTYGSEDSTYTFVILYDMEGNGDVYGIGAMYVGEQQVEILSATYKDGVWTVVTENATYTVTFTYNAEQDTFSASVTVED